MEYLKNSFASVRNAGVECSGRLAESFGQDWINTYYIDYVTNQYNSDKSDKKGYNHRMCCLKSLSVIMPFVTKDLINEKIIPIFLKACHDEIPNVKFCVSKILSHQKQYIDSTAFSNQLTKPLVEMQ